MALKLGGNSSSCSLPGRISIQLTNGSLSETAESRRRQGNGNPYVSDEEFPGLPELASSLSLPESMTMFSCDLRKTCGQMASCEEAYFHLFQCVNGRFDGDNDGMSCESNCR